MIASALVSRQHFYYVGEIKYCQIDHEYENDGQEEQHYSPCDLCATQLAFVKRAFFGCAPFLRKLFIRGDLRRKSAADEEIREKKRASCNEEYPHSDDQFEINEDLIYKIKYHKIQKQDTSELPVEIFLIFSQFYVPTGLTVNGSRRCFLRRARIPSRLRIRFSS